MEKRSTIILVPTLKNHINTYRYGELVNSIEQYRLIELTDLGTHRQHRGMDFIQKLWKLRSIYLSIWVFSSIFLLSIKSFAVIDPLTVVVENASAWRRPTLQATNPDSGVVGGGLSGNIKIFGGIMGSAATCAGIATCNNCIANNTPCNVRRITPNTELMIRFRTDNASVITPTSELFFLIGNQKLTPIQDPSKTTLSGIAVNAELSISIRWGDLCPYIEAGSDCSTSVANKSIQFGISTSGDLTLEESLTIELSVLGDPTGNAVYQYTTLCGPGMTGNFAYKGFCWASIKRGDEKVYIEDDVSDEYYNQGPPELKGKYAALRVFYAEGDIDQNINFDAVVNSSSSYKDFGFTIEGNVPTLNDRSITGLSNGQGYYFMFANVDEAENVFYFSNPAELSLGANKMYYTAIPMEVSGALEGEECFVATAAYGSPLAPQLGILRAFRDQFLKTNKWGQWFVEKYYIYGPSLAQKIKRHDSARAVVRGALGPVVMAAQWMILHGLKSFILFSFIGFISGFLIVRRMIRDYE